MNFTIITGDNGSGKTKIKDLLLSRKYLELISHTTREARTKEKEGKDYYFVGTEDMKTMSFIEQIEFGGKTYGISLEEALTKLKTKKDLVVIAEPTGVVQILKWLYGMSSVIEEITGSKINIFLVHLIVPYEWRLFRILKENLNNEEQDIALFKSIRRVTREKDVDGLMRKYVSDKTFSKVFRNLDESDKFTFEYLPVAQTPFPETDDDLEDVPMEIIENLLIERNIIKKKITRKSKKSDSLV